MLGHHRRRLPAGQDLIATDQIYDIWTRHGLLRTDVPNLRYAMSAVSTGFYLLEGDPVSAGLDTRAKADALARTIKVAFEPARRRSRPALAAAAEVAAISDDIIGSYRKVALL